MGRGKVRGKCGRGEGGEHGGNGDGGGGDEGMEGRRNTRKGMEGGRRERLGHFNTGYKGEKGREWERRGKVWRGVNQGCVSRH